jgi:uncharacterized protein (DUF305 family)
MDNAVSLNEFNIGKDIMREQILALIAHHMAGAASYHGKDSAVYEVYRDLIEEIREDQATEIENYKQPTQDE